MLPVLVLLLAVACAKSQKSGEAIYALEGKIVSRNAAENTLRVDHQAIPGFMDAMTMDYPVRGAKVTALPPDNTTIVATVHAGDSGYWLTDVKPRK